MREIIFRVSCLVTAGETVGVVGDCQELGDWKPEQALLLQRAHEYVTISILRNFAIQMFY